MNTEQNSEEALQRKYRLWKAPLQMSQRMTKPTKWHVRQAKDQHGHPPSLIIVRCALKV